MTATIAIAPCQEVIRLKSMADLRAVFPTPDSVDYMNFVLFSTSGIHGTYTTIEEAERVLRDGRTPETEGHFHENDPDCLESFRLTVLVIQPRCVTIRFGHIPVTLEDIPYLKALRQASWDVAPDIGRDRQR